MRNRDPRANPHTSNIYGILYRWGSNDGSVPSGTRDSGYTIGRAAYARQFEVVGYQPASPATSGS